MAGRMVLLRHGQTEWSKSGRHTGRTDVPLLEAGRKQAKVAGELVRSCTSGSFEAVFTSPLVRASESCNLAGFQGDPERDLMEWDYGQYEGRTTDEIRQDRPGWNLWDDGVPGGELVGEVGRRADRVIARARQRDGDTLCVAHGHFLRILTARWLGLPPVAGRLLALDPGSVCVLGWEREWPVIQSWNVSAG
jgi:probable phosphoglycerate mutase